MKFALKNNIAEKLFYIFGLFILSYSFIIYFVSSDLTYEAVPSNQELNYYIIIRIFIGIAYTIAVVVLVKNKFTGKNITLFIFSAGLISRILLIPTEPILEDDFNRYLWDGAISAAGYNPYEYSPKQIMYSDSLNYSVPHDLISLVQESDGIINKINFPHIRTIYPPIAQAAFAISYFVKPWSITIWKTLLLMLDILVFYLIILLLDKLKYSFTLIIIYWWNPILIHEMFNAGHMDLILYPFLVGALLYFLKQNYIVSSTLISLAVGVKIWPIIFIPFLLKKVWNNKKLFFVVLSLSVAIIAILLLPIFLTKIDDSLGFVTYSKNWTNNESVFQLVNIIVSQIIDFTKISYNCSLCLSRWVTILFFCGILTYFLKTVDEKENKFISVAFLLVAIMYLISPTQFPWYYTWALPFLVVNPRLSFVAYAILLPLYQLKYSWPYLVWIEHVPILVLFILELYDLRIKKILQTFNRLEVKI